MKTTLLNAEDLNVFTVGWWRGAVWPLQQAVSNTRVVGALIANFILALQVGCTSTAVNNAIC